MVGVALSAAWIVSRLPQRSLVIGGASLVLAACGLMAMRQTRVWRDTPTLFTHTIAVNPDSYAGYSNLATYAYRQADEESIAAQTAWLVFDQPGAERHRAEVRRLNEQYLAMARESYRVRPESIRTQRRMGDALLRLDRPAEAVPYLRDAVAAWERLSDEAQKRKYGTTPHLLAVALLRIGQPDEAAKCCERTLDYLPENAAAQRTLAAARAAMASVDR
jgi:tetratricopeptide (TPR) repeat protein